MHRPAHHLPDGRFRSPWPMASGDDALRRQAGRMAREWFLGTHPADPPAGAFATGAPAMAGVGGAPEVADGAVRVTWVGHATTLIQLPGLNLLTDPVWSDRCSPLPFMGPHRFVAPLMTLEELPPIHAVLLSHDHYDHLDRPTVRALHRRFGDDVTWCTPLGYRDWFAALGATRVVEHDWWEGVALPGGRFEAVAVPARHWTRRRPWGTNSRLWCGWVVRPVGSGAGAGRDRGPSAATVRDVGPGFAPVAGPVPGPVTGPGPCPEKSVYFAGDSGYCPAFAEIGERFGPFDVSLVPIGAYEPRWFMGAVHMNPEEAVQAYLDAGGRGAFVGLHWGTWRLTFEDPLEPPVRTRAAWADAGLPARDLHLLRHGETLTLP